MNSFVSTKNTILLALSTIGGFVANQLGGWNNSLKVLIGIMIADYATGVIVAAYRKSNKSKDGALSSKAGFFGLCRKCLILIIVWVSAMVDQLVGDNFIRTTVCMFFISNEGISVIENAGLMGIPLPDKLKNMFDILKNDKEEK